MLNLKTRTIRTIPLVPYTTWRLRIFIVTAAAAMVVTLFSSAAAQQIIPQTIQLETAYAGVRYDFLAQELLPARAPRLRWSLICKADTDIELECPKGVRLEDVLDRNGAVTGQKLVVEPRSSDLSDDGTPKVFRFDLMGVNDSGISVRIRIELEVRPLGVDTRRFQAADQSARARRDEDDVRNLVVGVTPARRVPPPPVVVPPEPFVLVKSTADEETIALTELFDDGFDPTANPCVICPDTSNRANFYIRDADVAPLVNNTIGTDAAAAANFKTGDYLVVHVVRWKTLKDSKSDPERELWALFEKIDPRVIGEHTYEWLPHFAASEKGAIGDKRVYDTRIYGSKRVFILPIHFNTPLTWDIKYKLNINQQVPTPIQNALQLAATVLGGGGPKAEVAPTTKDIWGARLMLVRYSASDLIVQVNAVTPDADLQIKEQNKDYSKKYDNEGRYLWDVSVGMPVTSIKELEYKVDNSVVSVKQVDRQNAYGFLNIFPRPVDLEANSFLTKPHLVLGVPISGKPLDRPIVALGTGIYRDFFKINFFAGVAFNKVREPRTLQVGDPATENQLETDIRTHRQPKFVFGINFPVRQFIEAIKKK